MTSEPDGTDVTDVPGGTNERSGGEHRLHPISLLFQVIGAVRALLIPLIVLLFASSDEDDLKWLGWLAVFVALSAARAAFHYLTYRYRFEGDELVVRGGVLFRFERHIPYARIQNIDLSQSPLHRLFDVADVRVETASGAEAEARLSVLSLPAVEAMRERVFAGQRRGTEDRASARETDEPVPILRLGPSDLVLFGVISNRGLAVVAAVLGLAWELELLPEDIPEDSFQRVELLQEGVLETLGDALPAVLLVLGALAALVLLRLLSIAWAFVYLHGFTLVRRGHDLQTRCGLLTRWTATIPRHRIQVVTISSNLLHRVFGRLAVKVDTAGGSSLEETAATRRWIAPLWPDDRLDELLAEIQPEVSLAGLDWQPVAPRALRRVVRKRVLLLLAAAAVAFTWGETWVAVSALVLVPPAIFDAVLRVRRLGWAMGPQVFCVRRGLWRQSLRIVRFPKMQVLSVSVSPFDRRWRMARLAVDTAGTPLGLSLPLLERPVAAGLAEELERRAAATEFRW